MDRHISGRARRDPIRSRRYYGKYRQIRVQRRRLMAETIRKAFVLRLKPGALDQYIYWHDNIWPELQQEIAGQGIAEITLDQIDDQIILTSLVRDPEAWARLWDSDVHRRWADLMSPLMHYRDDGIVDSRELREIWHFAPAA